MSDDLLERVRALNARSKEQSQHIRHECLLAAHANAVSAAVWDAQVLEFKIGCAAHALRAYLNDITGRKI
jgi:hypothetical protein